MKYTPETLPEQFEFKTQNLILYTASVGEDVEVSWSSDSGGKTTLFKRGEAVWALNSGNWVITDLIKPLKQEQEKQMKNEFPIEKLKPFTRVKALEDLMYIYVGKLSHNTPYPDAHHFLRYGGYDVIKGDSFGVITELFAPPLSVSLFLDPNAVGKSLWKRSSEAQLEAMKAYEEAKQKALSLGCELE
jgi:hypothetical protein